MSLHIRAAVTRATRALTPLWPLSSFIAVNPLAGHEAHAFDEAAPPRSREAFLADYRSGRITDADLAQAALTRVSELAGIKPVKLGQRVFTAAELVAAELVQGDLTGPSGGPHGGLNTGLSGGPHAGSRTGPNADTIPRADLVDELVSKWVAAYLDPHPLWKMPEREKGLWSAWAAMARYDPQLSRAARKHLRALPATADAAIADVLARLHVPTNEIERVLQQEAEHLPGWIAHIKWRADHVGDIDLTSYLAIRITLRWALGLPLVLPATPPTTTSATTDPAAAVWQRAATLTVALTSSHASPETIAQVSRILALHPQQAHAFTWQIAYEQHYRRELVASLSSAAPSNDQPSVQVIMCIDVRSEGMRRHLEVNPHIETYGFAGFFGVPIRFAPYQARASIDALPALLSARHFVTETPQDLRRAGRRLRSLRFRNAFRAATHAGESVPAAPFALAETLGWFFGATSLLRTLWPGSTNILARLRPTSTLPSSVTVADAFTLDERIALAEAGLRMMGLNSFAPLVVLAGHGSTSSNNLYQSALDCGACGGNPGAANARAAAAIFNDAAVRRALSGRGLPIPPDTLFVAVEHDTVSDQMHLLDRHLIAASHAGAVNAFLTEQSVAATQLVAERSGQLPGAARHSLARVRRRAHDWAEVYPELGLAGNAAMIIGPRAITRGVNLHRRVFLHSYQPHCDPDGGALETIMTAPLVVAQWISHQYYFSTIDQDRWGAGTKTIHNAIGTLGVLSGQTGDLRRGLPLQSVAVGTRNLHEPMRLSVLIEAPLERIGAIISRNQVLRHLFDNQWITLTARANVRSPWYRYGTYGWTLDPHPHAPRIAKAPTFAHAVTSPRIPSSAAAVTSPHAPTFAPDPTPPHAPTSAPAATSPHAPTSAPDPTPPHAPTFAPDPTPPHTPTSAPAPVEGS